MPAVISYTMYDRKHDNRKNLIDTLELPRDLICGEPIFTMMGDGDLLIENHRGIVQCSGQHIVVRTQKHVIRIGGDGLFLESYSIDGMRIRGKIEQIGIGTQ